MTQTPNQPEQSGTSTDQQAWDGYFIPGTGVLRNLLGISNQQQLRRVEEKFSFLRMYELRETPIAGSFDLDHMKRIHQHLFQDVYDWAGELRTPPMNKHGVQYAAASRIEPIWASQYSKLKKSGLLNRQANLEDPAQVLQLATFWGEINHAHAFREGNTRTQAVFFEQLCRQAGFQLDIARLSGEHPLSLYQPFVDARYFFQLRGDATPLADVLGKMLSPIKQKQAEQSAAPNWAKERLYQRFPELRPTHAPEPSAQPEPAELEFG
ncbi:MAG TPA: Fic family protein [Candidatus Lumbricidophila sp.]|nr:Fic family protein [Candidatus Lumbricidophila sp.]